jgi:GTP-binding protein
LGIRFLKHLTRTRLLLHLVDISPVDASDPVDNTLAIARELERFSPTLAQRERWLVVNKIDLLDDQDRAAAVERLVAEIAWSGPVFVVSAMSGEGTDKLCDAIMEHLEGVREREQADPELVELEQAQQRQMQREARERIAALRQQHQMDREQDEGDDDDDDDVEVVYVTGD